MKTTRKLTALLMAVTLLCALFAPVTVSAEVAAPQTVATATDPILAPLDLLARLDNGEKLCAVYNRIVDSIQKGEDSFFFEDGFTLTEEEQLILQTVVDATFPEGYGDYVGHSYCSLGEDYFDNWFYDWGLTAEMEAEVNQRVAELTADLYDKSDFDKCRILYERLIEENYYDFGEYHQTAYGALIEDKSVCAGYARAYQLLLQTVGIPCLYVTGTADNGYDVGGHAWNIVRLNGYWYYCDPTWDDYDDPSIDILYNYFNIPYTQISSNHFLDDGYELWVPKETAPAADYYTMSGLAVETVTAEQLIALLKKQNPVTVYVLGDYTANIQAIIDTFYNNQHTILAALGATGGSASWSYYSDSPILTLSLALDHDHDYLWQIDEATCTEYGLANYACQTCGDRGFNLIDPLGHDCGDAWDCYDTYHTQYCLRCGEAQNYGEHVYEKDGAHCDVCGYDNPAAMKKGDVNGDGKVNNRDLGVLQRYLNDLITEIPASADLNDDGKINNRDLGQLQKMLNV